MKMNVSFSDVWCFIHHNINYTGWGKQFEILSVLCDAHACIQYYNYTKVHTSQSYMNNNYSSTILSFHLYSYLKKKTSHKTMLHTHMHLHGSISTLVSLPISCVVVLLIYGAITIVLFQGFVIIIILSTLNHITYREVHGYSIKMYFYCKFCCVKFHQKLTCSYTIYN